MHIVKQILSGRHYNEGHLFAAPLTWLNLCSPAPGVVMEKRRWPREAAECTAILSLGLNDNFRCVIRDFSQAGMLVSLDDLILARLKRSAAVAAARPASICLELSDRSIAMEVEVVRYTEQGAGLRLLAPSLEIFQALRQAAAPSVKDAHRLPSNLQTGLGQLGSDHRQQLAKAGTHTFTLFLQDQFTGYFGQLETALLIEADRQKNQALQQPFFDAIALFRKQRQRVLGAAINRISETAMDIALGRQVPEQLAEQNESKVRTLELVDKDDFEDWLVVRVAISRAELQWRDNLIELQLRLDAAFGQRGGTRVFNPYSPSSLCNTFFDVIRHLGLKNKVVEVVFKVLQDGVLAHLGRVYHELNQLLIRADILPGLVLDQYLASQVSSGRPPREPSTRAALPVAEQPTPAVTAEPSTQRTATDGSSAAASFNTASQLMRLQDQLIRPDGTDSTALNGIEDHAVHLMQTLFDSIVQNGQIAEDLKPELLKLQAPFLKIMLKDPGLFSADSHPARQTLNSLALLCDQGSIHLETNRATILGSIEHILQSKDGLTGFSESLERLDAPVTREKRIIERNLSRIRETCAGQQRLIQANRQIERQLGQLFDRPVPTTLLDLIDHGWKDLMRLRYLRDGISSEAWDSTLTVLRHLLWHLLPPTNTQRKTPQPAQQLLARIDEGLSQIPEAGLQQRSLLDSLADLLRNGVQITTPMALYSSAELDDDILDRRLAEQIETDTGLIRWLKRARNLKASQWFELSQNDQPAQLHQLVWVADDASQFMFANHLGTRTLGLSLEGVAHLLRDGRLERLHASAMPAVEHGLDALVQTIYDKLTFDSTHDQLTGLLTRKEFSRRLAHCVAQAHQGHATQTLIFLDIQQFKVINNTCGYETGDRFLAELAAQLRSLAGEQALIGRVGPDQFALLVPLQADKAGYRLASELKTEIESTRFVQEHHRFVIRTVMALVGLDHTHQRVMDLLRSVEAAAEVAKRSGYRDIQVVQPDDARLQALDGVMLWITRINRALDENSLKLRCQKIMPLHDGPGALPHFEVLLTVIDEQGEHQPPADFIKVAEDYSRMGAVDRWVIEAVLRWMMEHRHQMHLFGGFSINLSGHSMNDDSFLDYLFDALVRYQVPRDKLIFEITETTAVSNLEDAADFINEMRSIGCRFSLDDFGVGQSSYSYLKRLPVDFIKIDGTFVRDITRSDVDFALVRSITEMGHYLNKQVIAEYVAQEDILETVSAIGVDYAQGHVYGLPCLLEQLDLDALSPCAPAPVGRT